MSYEFHIPRCSHIKTNGIQCGSPALRDRRYCFFHKNWQSQVITLNAPRTEAPVTFTMPVLEDADSIQVTLMQIMRLIVSGQVDHKAAGLLLYALQTASSNVRQLKLEQIFGEHVVIDPGAVSRTGLGDAAWHRSQFDPKRKKPVAIQNSAPSQARSAAPSAPVPSAPVQTATVHSTPLPSAAPPSAPPPSRATNSAPPSAASPEAMIFLKAIMASVPSPGPSPTSAQTAKASPQANFDKFFQTIQGIGDETNAP